LPEKTLCEGISSH